jgi:hypothetical protein
MTDEHARATRLEHMTAAQAADRWQNAASDI